MKPTVTISLQEYQSMKDRLSKAYLKIHELTEQIKKYTNGVTSEKTIYLRIDSYKYSPFTIKEIHREIYFTDKAEADKALLEHYKFLLEENNMHRESIRVAQDKIRLLENEIFDYLKHTKTTVKKPWYKRIF